MGERPSWSPARLRRWAEATHYGLSEGRRCTTCYTANLGSRNTCRMCGTSLVYLSQEDRGQGKEKQVKRSKTLSKDTAPELRILSEPEIKAVVAMANIQPRQAVIGLIHAFGQVEPLVFPLAREDREKPGGAVKYDAVLDTRGEVLAHGNLGENIHGTVGGAVKPDEVSRRDGAAIALQREAEVELSAVVHEQGLGELEQLRGIFSQVAIQYPSFELPLRVVQWTENGLARIRGVYDLILYGIMLNEEQYALLVQAGLVPWSHVPEQNLRPYLQVLRKDQQLARITQDEKVPYLN